MENVSRTLSQLRSDIQCFRRKVFDQMELNRKGTTFHTMDYACDREFPREKENDNDYDDADADDGGDDDDGEERESEKVLSDRVAVYVQHTHTYVYIQIR